MNQKPTIFEATEPKTSSYRDIVARAKEKTQTRPGPLEGMSRFDELSTEQRVLRNDSPSETQGPATLSDATVAGLEALARASENAPATAVRQEEPEPEKELTEQDRMRRAIEARCSPLDIGQYLLNNTCIQTVPIIVDKLVVRYRLATDAEEVFVDRQIRQESTGEELSHREVIRRMNEWAVAFGVHTLNGKAWPSPVKPDGTVDEEAAADRLALVRRLSFPVFSLLFQNLAWFTERVNNTLTLETLKNG